MYSSLRRIFSKICQRHQNYTKNVNCFNVKCLSKSSTTSDIKFDQSTVIYVPHRISCTQSHLFISGGFVVGFAGRNVLVKVVVPLKVRQTINVKFEIISNLK